MSRPGRRVVVPVLAAVLAMLVPGQRAAAAATPARFLVGAAVGDFTPPLFGALTDSLGQPVSDPADCIAGTPAEAVFTGPRAFALEEPYVDLKGSGHFDAGDPFIDCNQNGRWDGNFIGGGANTPRYYTHVADPVEARATVVGNGSTTIAVEVLDQEGVFNVIQQRIRDTVTADLLRVGRHLDGIFISATHDESAPDTLGLYGPSLEAAGQSAPTSLSSSVNAYFVDYLVRRSADAIERADMAMRPATIRFAEATEPANLRQCWSSYPYIDDQLMPVMQAVDSAGRTIVTLVSVSQHAETLGFNPSTSTVPASDERLWLSADLPHAVRAAIEQRYGGMGIAMAGSVGSVETPEVFAAAVSRIPQKHIDESHPAGCRTLFTAAGSRVPLGYAAETAVLGQSLAGAVISALDTGATASITNDLWGRRVDVCVPVSNALFLAAGGLGIFGLRPGYVGGCAVQVAPLPNGTTTATEILSQAAAFRIGDGSFLSLPGEVFPFTYLRGFVGPDDLPYTTFGMPPWLLPHLHTPYRFIDGLGEDMIGYIFPQGNGVGVPGEYPTTNPTASGTDRFGCGHSDDSEAANSQAADLIGTALVPLLDSQGGPAEDIRQGRYVLANGSLSRDPLGGPEVKCDVDTGFAAAGSAVAVWLPGRGAVIPASWMSLSGRVQAAPDRNTRGWVDAAGTRHWLDVYPNLAGAPAAVVVPGVTSGGPGGGGAGGLPGTLASVPAGAAGAAQLCLMAGAAVGARRRRRR